MLCDEAHDLSSLFADFCRHCRIANQRNIGAVCSRIFLVGRQNAAALRHAGWNQTRLTSGIQKAAPGGAVKYDLDIDLLFAKFAAGGT